MPQGSGEEENIVRRQTGSDLDHRLNRAVGTFDESARRCNESMRCRCTAILACAVALLLSTSPALALNGFTLFETGQVRPLALSPDAGQLFVANTPDNTLEIFDVSIGGLTPVASVPVGLEPIAVAARTNTEVWVVNHLSDSISIVDLSGVDGPRVVRTLLVGDEPRDIVFAGPGGNRAFITCAHRGQNNPNDPQLTTPGVPRADVWVFDALNLGTSMGGDELTIVQLFGDTPRALAVSNDGSTVYAAVFHSGNQTTALNEGSIPDGGQSAGGLPLPNTNFAGQPQPETGLIVKFDGAAWRDGIGRDWSSEVKFSLPDFDVFAIDANASTPAQVSGPAGAISGVGTILFNMAVNPVSGKIYVSNTEAFNEVRFEGKGDFLSTFGDSTVRGHLHESSITVIDGTTATRRHLNKHIDYSQCCAKPGKPESQASLAFPLQMAVSSDGSTLYVAAFGSSKIGVFDTAQLENDTFSPSPNDHIKVTGGGPTGLILDESRSQLYVLTRFDDSVSVVSTGTGAETAHVALHNPEPQSVVQGRPFLYDAAFTSSHGDSACASCHVFGDFDSLAWDLGDPDGSNINNPGPFTVGPFINPDFRPMKGPMTTQSLRGMDNHGPMHWRGGRTGGNLEVSAQPNRGTFNEDLAFKAFNVAFEGLVGRDKMLKPDEMQAFTDFALQIMYPPNPVRALDNSLTPEQQAGHDLYFGRITDTFQNCNGCHVLDPNANGPGTLPPGVQPVDRPGFFGTDGRYSFKGETQIFKISHLRNQYQKVGMFGMAQVPFLNAGDNGFKGPQVRGFGFLHDGSTDTVFRFLQGTVFNKNGVNTTGIPVNAAGDVERQNLEAFMLAFDSNHAPIVGQQITRTSTNGATVDPRIDLMIQRANAGECDVVVKGIESSEARGAVYVGGGDFETDRVSGGTVADAALRALSNTAGQELTYTAVPVSDGFRIGVDRDNDSFRDADERDAGSDPNSGISMLCNTTTAQAFKKVTLKDSAGKLNFKDTLPIGSAYANQTIQITVADGGGLIFDSGVLGDAVVVNKSGKVYKFKADKGVTGIVRVIVKNDKKVPGGIKVTIKTKLAWAPGLADEPPATTTVRVNVAGTCFDGNATRVR